ncbi:unnamed protein product [Musa acuminata subsp. burmannicoides]
MGTEPEHGIRNYSSSDNSKGAAFSLEILQESERRGQRRKQAIKYIRPMDKKESKNLTFLLFIRLQAKTIRRPTPRHRKEEALEKTVRPCHERSALWFPAPGLEVGKW